MRTSVPAAGAEAQHLHAPAAGRRHDPLRHRVVGVHHRGRGLHGARRVAAVEQHELGVEVGLERAVVVEVVVAQVREHRHVEVEPVAAALDQGVAAQLERHGLHAGVRHLAQQRLQLGGLGRGVAERAQLAVEAGAVVPSTPGRQPAARKTDSSR